MFVVGLPSSARIFQQRLRLHFGCNNLYSLRGFLAPAASLCCWTPRSVFQDGSDDTGLANSAPWRVVTDVIVGRSRRRTRALPALVLCPPRGRSGLRRTLRVPAALPRCWVRTRIAPRPPPLAAHPFPSVHMGRLSRLGWRSQCMLTQLWGCKHPERPRAQGATCRHAFCPARGSCWHWPPGSDCCRAPGRIRGPLAEASCRAQAAARCAHRAAPEPKNR